MFLEMKSISLLIKRVGQGLQVDREIYSIRACRNHWKDRDSMFKSPAFYSVLVVVLFLKGKICIRLLLLLTRYHGENGLLIGKGNEKRKREKGKLWRGKGMKSLTRKQIDNRQLFHNNEKRNTYIVYEKRIISA